MIRVPFKFYCVVFERIEGLYSRLQCSYKYIIIRYGTIFSVGVYAKWCSGKSFLLRSLRRELEAFIRGCWVMIKINSLIYFQLDCTLSGAVARALSCVVFEENWRPLFEAFESWLRSTLWFIFSWTVRQVGQWQELCPASSSKRIGGLYSRLLSHD
jgi:hypothetical protein